MRRMLGLCLTVAAVAWPAGAGAEGGSACRFVAEFTLTPGLSVEAGSGTFTSGGRTGTIVCRATGGSAAGEARPFGAEGRYGTSDPDTCAAGEGDGVQSFTVPGPGGDTPVTNAIRFVFRAVSADGVMAGRFEGERFSGRFTITPLDGDCVTRPVTRVRLRGQGHLRDP